MLKLRSEGGLKLIHLLTKSHASLCIWLVRLITSPDLLLNLQILKNFKKNYKNNRVETLDIVTFEFFFVIQDSAAKIFPTRLLVAII